MKKIFFVLFPIFSVVAVNAQIGKKPTNIISILADDHRYYFIGFINTVLGLQTPGMVKIGLQLRG